MTKCEGALSVICFEVIMGTGQLYVSKCVCVGGGGGLVGEA